MAAVQEAQSPNWQVDLLWAAVFLDTAATQNPAAIWTTLFGAPPESASSEVAEGGVGATRSAVIVAGARLGFQQTFSPSTHPVVAPFARFDEAWRVFVGLTKRWRSLIEQPILRIAVGAVVMAPRGSADDAYRTMSTLVPVRFRQDGADFVYQINRWKKLPDGLFVNRISRWSVGEREFHDGAGGKATRWTCGLELDLNTDRLRMTPIPNERIDSLVDGFAEDAHRFAREGDR